MDDLGGILMLLSMVGTLIALIGIIKGSIKFLKIYTRKKAAMMLLGCFVLFVIGGTLLDTSTTDASKVAVKDEFKKDEKAPEPKGDNNANKDEEPLTLEEKIKKIIIETIDSKTNMKQERIISKSIENEQLYLTLHADENFTENMTKSGIISKSSDLFKNIFPEVAEIDEIILTWQLVLVDKYGNEKNGNVILISLTREINDKINWQNFIISNLPEVAKDYWEHPLFSR